MDSVDVTVRREIIVDLVYMGLGFFFTNSIIKEPKSSRVEKQSVPLVRDPISSLTRLNIRVIVPSSSIFVAGWPMHHPAWRVLDNLIK